MEDLIDKSEWLYEIKATSISEGQRLGEYTIKGYRGSIAEKLHTMVEKEFFMDCVQQCHGCAYEDTEEWKMPCCKCKRACKDYYRGKGDWNESKRI